MESITVRRSDPYLGEIISNAISGKKYRKMYVCKVIGTDNIILEFIGDKLVLLYRKSINHLPAIELEIEELVISDQKTLHMLPDFLFKQSKCVVIKNNFDINDIPGTLRPKIKKQMYKNSDKHEMKPNSKYLVSEVEALFDVNFDNIRCLVLSSYYEKLEEIVKYLVEQVDTYFRKVHVIHRYTGPRENAELFDMSLLANIRTGRLFINNGPFKNLRGLVATTTIPEILWIVRRNESMHSLLLDVITEELKNEPEIDISENYTLIKFRGLSPYEQIYRDVVALAARNRDLANDRRFRATKALEPAI